MDKKSFGPSGSNKSVSPGTGKGYSRAASASSAQGISPTIRATGKEEKLTILSPETIKKREVAGDEPQTAIGSPWFKAYILFDGLSHEVNELFEPIIYNIGEASGRLIHFVDIGDPADSDPVYEKMRTAKLREHDSSASKNYKKETNKGRDNRLYRLKEQWKLAKWLGVERGNQPCIAFTTNPPWYPMVFLKLKSAYYSLSEGRNAFGHILIDWLSNLKPERFERPDILNRDLLHLLETEINKLAKTIDNKVASAISVQKPLSTQRNLYRAIMHNGTIELSQDAYEDLMTSISDFDLFIDGFTKSSWTKKDNKLQDAAELTFGEYSLSIKLIKNRNYVEPYNVAGASDNSSEAEYKMFNRLRKKIDLKTGPRSYRSFKLRKIGNPPKRVYCFHPPEDFRYCLIIPEY